MADVTTSLLQLVLQETGNNPNNWGEILNETLSKVETAIAGANPITTTGGTTTLTDDEARCSMQQVSGTLGSAAIIVIPNRTRFFVFANATSGSYTTTVKTSGGSGIVIPQGKTVLLWCNGSDGVSAFNVLDGAIDAGAIGTGAVGNDELAANAVTSAKVQDGSLVGADLAASTVSNTNLAFDGGPFSGFRNRLINGDFRIDQRWGGAASTLTAGGALVYVIDRWYAYCTGANVTFQQVAGASGSPFRARFTGAASVTGVYLGQRIERLNSADMAGGVATLSMRAASSSLTTLNWAIYYASTNDSFGTVASPTRTSIASGSFTINSTEAVYAAANISIPSGATTGIEVVISGGALLSGQTLTIGDVNFEVGPAALPFERRPYSVELMACMRYFEKWRSAQRMGFACPATGGFAHDFMWTYKVTKRIAPALTLNASSFSNVSVATVIDNGVEGFTYQLVGGGALNASGYLQPEANAEL